MSAQAGLLRRASWLTLAAFGAKGMLWVLAGWMFMR